jgi:hypothetical protein
MRHIPFAKHFKAENDATNETLPQIFGAWAGGKGVYFFPVSTYNWGGFREDIQTGRCLAELLKKLFLINSINFDLGRLLGELLEMLLGYLQCVLYLVTQT